MSSINSITFTNEYNNYSVTFETNHTIICSPTAKYNDIFTDLVRTMTGATNNRCRFGRYGTVGSIDAEIATDLDENRYVSFDVIGTCCGIQLVEQLTNIDCNYYSNCLLADRLINDDELFNNVSPRIANSVLQKWNQTFSNVVDIEYHGLYTNPSIFFNSHCCWQCGFKTSANSSRAVLLNGGGGKVRVLATLSYLLSDDVNNRTIVIPRGYIDQLSEHTAIKMIERLNRLQCQTIVFTNNKHVADQFTNNNTTSVLRRAVTTPLNDHFTLTA